MKASRLEILFNRWHVLSYPFNDFVQPFNILRQPFNDFIQPFNGLSYRFKILFHRLPFQAICFWTLFNRLILLAIRLNGLGDRLNAWITCLLSIYSPFIFTTFYVVSLIFLCPSLWRNKNISTISIFFDKVTVMCKCGRRSENFPCLQGGEKVAVAQAYQRWVVWTNLYHASRAYSISLN